MKATISHSYPTGSVIVPPSKSLCHRAIIAASLTNGTSIIENVSYSKDIQATIAGMKALGAIIIEEGTTLHITGIGKPNQLTQTTIDCNESGSTLRFFIPIFSLSNQEITFTGKGRLLERPQNIYQNIFTSQQLSFIHDNQKICINGSLKADDYVLDGSVSSQFISGLLFALPFINGTSTITIQEPFESRSYVDLTVDILRKFQIEVTWKTKNCLEIKGNQQYQPTNYRVERDYSQAAFFCVLGALQQGISLHDLSKDSHQGDFAIVSILKQAGIEVSFETNTLQIKGGIPNACEIDLADCPDLGPILMVLAAFSKGTTHIYHAKRLRYKESDRIDAMETELKKLGVQITSTEDEVWVEGKDCYQGGVVFDSHNDHRIVMSLTIASSLCSNPCTIEGAQAITKSYPNFFEDFQSIKGKAVLSDDY